jgi:hypothetical protein
MLETALHWKRMISAQTVALKMKMKMHLYVVQMEMSTGKEIYTNFFLYQTGQGFEGVKMFL